MNYAEWPKGPKRTAYRRALMLPRPHVLYGVEGRHEERSDEVTYVKHPSKPTETHCRPASF